MVRWDKNRKFFLFGYIVGTITMMRKRKRAFRLPPQKRTERNPTNTIDKMGNSREKNIIAISCVCCSVPY